MKPALGVVTALAVLAVLTQPAATSATSLNLSWDRCFGDGNVYDKVFSCDTNDGTDVLVGSFELDQTLPGIYGMDASLYFATTVPVLPTWWDFTAPARAGSLSGSLVPQGPMTNCRDGWNGRGAGGIAAVRTCQTMNPTPACMYMKIILSFGLAAVDAFTAHAGEEQFAFALLIDHASTGGPGAAGGCDVPLCISFSQLALDHGLLPGPPATLYLPDENTQAWKSTVTWNGAARATGLRECSRFGCWTFPMCESPTPAQNRTWGTIKSMYR